MFIILINLFEWNKFWQNSHNNQVTPSSIIDYSEVVKTITIHFLILKSSYSGQPERQRSRILIEVHNLDSVKYVYNI